MKKALLLICAASILAGMCGCSKTIENPLGINPDSRTTSSTTPVPQTLAELVRYAWEVLFRTRRKTKKEQHKGSVGRGGARCIYGAGFY